MCPTVENQEQAVRLLGQNHRDEAVYAFSVDLETPDILDSDIFDRCLREAVRSVRLASPGAIEGYEETVRDKFKWVGYLGRWIVFNESFSHIDVRDLVLATKLISTQAQGAGRLTISPSGRLIHGGSGTLLDDKAFTRAESERYK